MGENKAKSPQDKAGTEEEDDEKVGRLSQDTLKYFQRVEQVLDDNVFDDEEQKETFMRNVFVQIETDGTHLARHSNKTSRIIEKIIPCLSHELFEKFLHLIQDEIEMLSSDRFSSHVIETICKNCTTHLSSENFAEVFVAFCKVLRKHSSKLIRNTYGSHVLSTVLQVLSGVTVPELVTKSQTARKMKKKAPKGSKHRVEERALEPVVIDVPRIFKKCFKKYVQVILDDINFGELLCHRNASPVLQVMLLASSKVSEANYQLLYEAIVSRGKILELEESGAGVEEDDDELLYRLPVVFTDEVGSHLFEALIKSANDEQLEELGGKCFKRCILSLCIHPLGNYLAQTYLRCVKTSEHVDFFISRMMKYLEDILAAGSMGCVVRLAELISKFEKTEYQKKYIAALSETLHIPEDPKENPFSKLVMCMRTYDFFFKSNNPEETSDLKPDENPSNSDIDPNKDGVKNLSNDDINYHGCCLLQHLFSFKKCRRVVESFLLLTPDELKVIACNPYGSFSIEHFCKSENVPAKSKTILGENLLCHTYELACDKFGSRVIDCLFKSIDDGTQERFKYILREHKSRLETNLYGRIVLYNCGVKQYVNTMREIQEQQQQKRKKMFEEILEEPIKKKEIPVVQPKKKKDDRAERYRKQLAALGIAIEGTEESNKEEKQNDDSVKKEEIQEEDPQSPPDDLCDVLSAIEASVIPSRKKVKIGR